MRGLFPIGLFAFVTAAAGCIVPAAPASAAIYDWILSDGGDSGSGTLTTGAPDDGGFDVTAFSGEIDGDIITSLLGGQPGSGGAYSPSGAFQYDNIVFPASNSSTAALLDVNGILFSIAGGEGNLWGNSPGPGGYSYYASVSGNYVIENNSATFVLTSIAEPASLTVLAAALGACGLIRRPQNAGQPAITQPSCGSSLRRPANG